MLKSRATFFPGRCSSLTPLCGARLREASIACGSFGAISSDGPGACNSARKQSSSGYPLAFGPGTDRARVSVSSQARPHRVILGCSPILAACKPWCSTWKQKGVMAATGVQWIAPFQIVKLALAGHRTVKRRGCLANSPDTVRQVVDATNAGSLASRELTMNTTAIPISRLLLTRTISPDRASAGFRPPDEAASDVACGVHGPCWVVDCAGSPRSAPGGHRDSRDCRRGWRRRRAQHVLRRRHRCRNDAHRHAADSSRHGLARGSARLRPRPGLLRRRGAWSCAQLQAARRCSPSRSSSTPSCTRCGSSGTRARTSSSAVLPARFRR